jgi:hypothetical protein
LLSLDGGCTCDETQQQQQRAARHGGG